MEGIRSFLDSSSINGLNHISTTKGLSRLFWIFVVFSGFLVSGFLIHQSFQSWEQQPIVTTIETLPADEMKMPKVTVCPPKNMFTDLNYDLMLARNMTFSNGMREELRNYAEYAIDIGYLNYLSKVEVKDHFYKWYKGTSLIELPTLRKDKKTAPHLMIDFTLKSYALSGNITSEYFGQKFNLDLIERNVNYQVQIHIPDYLKNNENISIHLKYEWIRPDKGSGRVSMSKDPNGHFTLQDYKEYSLNLKHDTLDFIRVNYIYKLTEKDFQNFQMDSMPGFKLSWYYSGDDLKSLQKPVAFVELTNAFRRKVNKVNIYRKVSLLNGICIYEH